MVSRKALLIACLTLSDNTVNFAHIKEEEGEMLPEGQKR
jgi:hypothetical protein